MGKRKAKRSKGIKYLWIALIMPLVLLILIYVGISLSFLKTYSYGTVINGVDYTGKSAEYVERELLSGLNSYELTINERENEKEVISGKDINLKWSVGNSLDLIKDKQNCFTWIFNGLSKYSRNEVEITVSYDRELLLKKLDELKCLDISEVIEPQNAYIYCLENGFEIIGDIPGNEIDEEKLLECVERAVNEREPSVDLYDEGCYKIADITSEAEILLNSMKDIDRFTSANITYNFETETKTLEKFEIEAMIDITDNIASISRDKAGEYIKGLKTKYDTVGSQRDFITWDGRRIKVANGNYGFSIALDKETDWLVNALSEGITFTRTPEYETEGLQRGITDIGNTYIEIDMTKQHMWFYQKGYLVADTDVVTGNTGKGYGTPSMVAYIRYKERNATLKGENYRTPVDYWMPIYKNIGIHDADWRTSFGGEIYKTNGSHGCINTPPSVAKTIFEKVEVGTPVILYY